jgi:TonB family protein
MDLMNIFQPSVQLEVHTDIAGKATDVEVLRSSGSNNIDEPVRLAMYQWWFEPPKDQHGKPKADVTVWTISFW